MDLVVFCTLVKPVCETLCLHLITPMASKDQNVVGGPLREPPRLAHRLQHKHLQTVTLKPKEVKREERADEWNRHFLL